MTRVRGSAPAGAGAAPPPVRSAPPFIGREAELAFLEVCLTHALAGQPRVVLVRGIAGVGKTRLIKEFGRRAEARGARLCYGRWHEDLSLPYLPFAEGLFTELVAAAARDELPGAAGEMAFLGALQPHAAPPARAGAAALAGGEADKLRLFLAVSRAAIAWARHRPAMLVFDDLHWSDRPSVELLSHLAFAVTDLADREAVPLLVVVAYRAEELGGEAARAVARLQRDERCASIDLAGLDHADVAELLRGMGLLRPSRSLGALIAETTEGNPLFVQEAVHYLRARGALRSQGGALVSTVAAGDLRLPDDVKTALAGHLDDVSAPCREVLTRAAFLGTRLSLEALAGLGYPPGQLEAAVEEGFVLRLLQRDGDELQFAHPLIRHVLYSSPTPAQRRALHLRIADDLTALDGGSGSRLLEIAHHLVNAGPAAAPARVVDVARRAAEHAFAIFAWADAGRFYEAALAAAEALPADQALASTALAELHLRAAWAHYRASDLGPCQDQFDRAIAAYTRAGMLGQRAEALLGKLRMAIPAAAYGVTVDTQPLEEMLATLGDEHMLLRGRIAHQLSEAYWHGRQTAKAEAMARLALSTAEQARDERLCAEASNGLALAMMQGLHIREALSLWERSLEHARRSGDAWAAVGPFPRLPLALCWLGEVERSRAAAREAAAAMQRIHDWAEHSVVLAHLAGLATLQGDFADAERLARETMRLVAFSHYPWGGVAVLTALAGARALRGAWDEAEDAIDALVAPGRLFDEPGAAMTFSAWVYRLLIAALRGEPQPASAETAAAMIGAMGSGAPDMGAIAVLCALVDVADACGNAALAAPVVPGLELAAARGVVISYGWIFLVPRSLGVAAALRRDWPAADRHFAAALQLAARVDAQPELGRICLDWSRALLARETPAARERAAPLLRQAHAVAVSLGMSPWAERAAALAATAGVALPAPGEPAAALSEREAQLLRLIARGAGEDAIAAELLVGPATLVRLQARLFDKLGVREASAAARLAAARGLLPEPSPPAPAAAAAPSGDTLRILLFTDMVDYTGVIEQLGDQRAQALLRVHNRVIRGCLARCGGTEIKHTGDGVLATFRTAASAIECAAAVQEAFRTGAHDATPLPIRVRIGINAGEPLVEEGDLYGASVNLAARVCARAGAGEILVSEIVRQLATGAPWAFAERGRVALKGFRGRHRLYAVELSEAAG